MTPQVNISGPKYHMSPLQTLYWLNKVNLSEKLRKIINFTLFEKKNEKIFAPSAQCYFYELLNPYSYDYVIDLGFLWYFKNK